MIRGQSTLYVLVLYSRWHRDRNRFFLPAENMQFEEGQACDSMSCQIRQNSAAGVVE